MKSLVSQGRRLNPRSERLPHSMEWADDGELSLRARNRSNHTFWLDDPLWLHGRSRVVLWLNNSHYLQSIDKLQLRLVGGYIRRSYLLGTIPDAERAGQLVRTLPFSL